MTKSDRLKPIAKIADDRQRRAAAEMATARSFHESQAARLQQLIDYKKEYEEKFTAHGTKALTALHVANFRQFIDRLEELIVEQRRQVAAAEEQFAARRRAWLASRTKVKALDKAIERFADEEMSREAKKEQRESDDRPRRDRRDDSTD